MASSSHHKYSRIEYYRQEIHYTFKEFHLLLVMQMQNLYLYTEKLSSDLCDFTFDNPHDTAFFALISLYHKHVEPLNPELYAYCTVANFNTQPSPKIFVSNFSKKLSPLSFEYEDIIFRNRKFWWYSYMFVHVVKQRG
ncbi:unnamed protein product [Rotaria magnacalcarata]|uniref:Uncharacterized protein n=1 Tax=Rotaria magnacalcarata TaxID=392030 RepID=A0A816TIN8_9BILA|nr:unnamed protein product [Rotaria magnacalcarata]